MHFLRTALFLLALALPIGLTSCATPTADTDRPSRDESTSSIPWNRPAGWEGTAGIPGLGGTFRGGQR